MMFMWLKVNGINHPLIPGNDGHIARPGPTFEIAPKGWRTSGKIHHERWEFPMELWVVYFMEYPMKEMKRVGL